MSKSYEGQELIIHFESRKCIHARKCGLNAPHIFDVSVKDWIKPDNGTTHEAVAVANMCPSGAITYEYKDGRDKPEIKTNILHINENGPLAIRGNLEISGEDARQNATLCRCGLSRKKPYCDGAHKKGGFIATGEVERQTSEALAEQGGTLAIRPLKDGPLYITGNLELCAGSGAQQNRTTKTALCRCGASKNKPYCDGSHKTIGFEADGA